MYIEQIMSAQFDQAKMQFDFYAAHIYTSKHKSQ